MSCGPDARVVTSCEHKPAHLWFLLRVKETLITSISAATNDIHQVTKRWFGLGCGHIWGHIPALCYEKEKEGRLAALLELIQHCGLN